MTGRVPGPAPGTPPPRVAGKKDSLPTPPLCLTPSRYGTATASERAVRVMTADRGIASPGEASVGSTRFRGFPDSPESATVCAPDSRRLPVQIPLKDPHGALHNV
jgi:hypothetical protein